MLGTKPCPPKHISKGAEALINPKCEEYHQWSTSSWVAFEHYDFGNFISNGAMQNIKGIVESN